MKYFPHLLLVATATIAVSGCTKSDTQSTSAPETTAPPMLTTETTAAPTAAAPSAGSGKSVTLVAYDSFALTDLKFAAFTEQTGIKVKVVNSGDTGEMVNKSVLTKSAPLGDVMWGVDTTFLDRAIKENLFAPTSVDTLDLDPTLTAGVKGKPVVPVDFGDVCVNYDKAALTKAGVPVPTSIDDLTKSTYKNMLVVENPATSSPGLAFLLATVVGTPDWKATWNGLKDNGVLIANGWTEAYETHFTAGGNGGDRPLVVSYGTSPVAAVLYGADPKATSAPTGIVESTCFRQVEYAGVLTGTKNTEAATKLLEYLISPELQADIQLNMFVYPANTKAATVPAFTSFAVKPAKPFTLDASEIAENRDGWIDEWSKLML
jgi:thiamine transport system substrate-binding protein